MADKWREGYTTQQRDLVAEHLGPGSRTYRYSSNLICTWPHRVLHILVVCLAATHAAQAGRVHVLDSGTVGNRVLGEDHVEDHSLGEQSVSLNPGRTVLLERCLADSACSEALAAAGTTAAAARQPQLQQRPRNQHTWASHTAASVFFSGAQHDLQQQQQQRQHSQAEVVGDSIPTSGGGGVAGPFHDPTRPWAGGGDVDDDVGMLVGSDGAAALHQGPGGGGAGGGRDDEDDDPTSLSLKGLAALVLFLEAVAGMYLPLLLQRLQSPQWWLSLLNCFSGGIFLAAGIIHLLPHCAEAQEALGPIGPNGDYPLYLVLVVVGYCVVFYVERVLFDVHGEGHAHCQHSNVFSHSSYYKAISHRANRHPNAPTGAPAVTAAAAVCTAASSEPMALPASAHASRAGPGAEPASGGPAALQPHHHHHHHHQHYRPPQPQLEGCSGGQSVQTLDDKAGAAAWGGPGSLPHHGGHGHQHSHQRGGHSHGHSHAHEGGSLPQPSGGGAEGGALRFVAAGVGLVLPAPVVDDEDTESCHSEHEPRAVCVCVEEKRAEAEAEARSQCAAAASSHASPHSHGHPLSHGQLPGPGHAHCHSHGRGGPCGDSGGGGDDLLRAPLLLPADRTASEPQPPMPSTPAGAVAAGCASAAADAVAPASSDVDPRGLALTLPLPLHPPDSCAYHTHHHPHLHHHRHRRRSAGPVGGSAGGAAFDNSSRPSSRASSLAGFHLHLGHSHPHAHSHHVHVIKPRFRFMHGVVLLAALALHTSLECIALGLIDSRPQFLLLFAAIASHKVVSALALASRFLREGATLGQVTAYVGPFCLVAPVSILAGVYVGRVAPIARLVFSCFATGTFLYVGASEVIMEEFEGEMRADRRDISTRAARYLKFLAVLAAVALVAASGLLPEPDHH